ncbi:hypothetical protein AX15_001528 [Amanita polypyramis BW_CC]|nr:hypothetical protein AX15_001528 [Amanita polypyramis BW_CC]
MPPTIITFDEDDSDNYVDFGPADTTLVSNGTFEDRDDDAATSADDFIDLTIADYDESSTSGNQVLQDVENVQQDIRKIDDEIARLNRYKSLREHDLRSLQSRLKMMGGRGKGGSRQETDYERGNFDWSGRLLEQMRTVFKIENFRFCQRGVCNAVLDKRDVFCVMPTGGGKSLTYQLPALLQPGCTLVISPLVALITDQIYQLRERGIEAVRMTGGTHMEERGRIYSRLYALANDTLSEDEKEIKLFYVTPEMICRNNKFKGVLTKLSESHKLARIVIDEAHCVSELGHDFRKDYGNLCVLRKYYPSVPILAISATCPPRVLGDVIGVLGLRSVIDKEDPKRTLYFSSPLYRKNLHYSILPKPEGQKEAIKVMSDYILDKHPEDSGIIYCQTQKESEMVAKELQEFSNGRLRTGVYHAGRDDVHKEKLHDEWRKGNVKIVCATIAFGLGIDKADVRFVLHYTISKSVECYYQESGRAGRDGRDSHCILFYRPQDCLGLFRLTAGQKDGRDKVLAMIRFSENLILCRKLLFARYFSVASQLEVSSWTTEDVDASDPCGHCDNCTRSPESIEERDVTRDVWKLVNVANAIERPLTLKQLSNLARGNNGGVYELPKRAKARIDLNEVIGSPVGLKGIETEHLINHMMTEKYLVEKVEPNEHTVNVYLVLGPASQKLLHINGENVPKGMVRHIFRKHAKIPRLSKPRVRKDKGVSRETERDNGEELVPTHENTRRKRKRTVAEPSAGELDYIISDCETEEVEKSLVSDSTIELQDEELDDDMDVTYGFSHSMLSEPRPVKRRCHRTTNTNTSGSEYVPDSESEREREQIEIDISSD